MDVKQFCKKEFENFLWCGAGALTIFFVSREIKKILVDYHLTKKMLQRVLEKNVEASIAIELIQTLEALEKEIKASQNEELLRLHETLIKIIKASPNF